MNLASVSNTLLFFLPYLLPFLGVLTLLVLLTRFTIYRRPPCSLEDVEVFVRKIDVLELAAALDPQVPLTLRKSLSDDAYRRELNTHIRLVREYISRVNHNAHVIQNWVAGEYSQMAGKNPKEYTIYEQLVVEALQTAAELRNYALAAQAKLWIWEALHIDRWPTQLLPRVPKLRILYGVDVLANYLRLTEITRTLSRNRRYGHRDLGAVL